MNVQKLFLLLGSNLGDRFDYLELATQKLKNILGNAVLSSSVYETAAWGNIDQPGFLNQVLAFGVDNACDKEELLNSLLAIEKELGRVRIQRWGDRTIDIDILFIGDEIIETPNLVVPHPRLHLRRFVLVPLNEIAPGLVHPQIKKTVNELLTVCNDNLEVQKWTRPS